MTSADFAVFPRSPMDMRPGSGVDIVGNVVSLHSPVMSTIIAAGKPWLDMETYLTVDAEEAADLTYTLNGTTVSRSVATWTAEDAAQHKSMCLEEAGDWYSSGDHSLGRKGIWTTIQAVAPDGKSCTIATQTKVAATGTGSGWWGTDNTSAVDAACRAGFQYLRLPTQGGIICSTVRNRFLTIKLIEGPNPAFTIYQRDEWQSNAYPTNHEGIFSSNEALDGLTIRGPFRFRMFKAPRVVVGNSAIYFEGPRHGTAAGATNHDQRGISLIGPRCEGAQYDPWVIAQCTQAYVGYTKCWEGSQGWQLGSCSHWTTEHNEMWDMTSIVVDQVCYQYSGWEYQLGPDNHNEHGWSHHNRAWNCPNFAGALVHDGDWFWSEHDTYLNTCAGMSLAPTNATAPGSIGAASDNYVDHLFIHYLTWAGTEETAISGNSQYQGIEIWGEHPNQYGSADYPIHYAEIIGYRCFRANAGPNRVETVDGSGCFALYQYALRIDGNIEQLILDDIEIADSVGTAIWLSDWQGPVTVEWGRVNIIRQQAATWTDFHGASQPLTANFVLVQEEHPGGVHVTVDHLHASAAAGVTVSSGLFLYTRASPYAGTPTDKGTGANIRIGPDILFDGTITHPLNRQVSGGATLAPVQLAARKLGHLFVRDGIPTIGGRGGLGGTGQAVALDPGSTDARGSFTVTAGPAPAGPPADLCTITFGVAYPSGKARVIVRPADANAAGLGMAYGSLSGGGSFIVHATGGPPVNGQLYTFTYECTEFI